LGQNSSLSTWANLTVMQTISHDAVLELLGDSFLYGGKSISDGMPNTLLAAIIMNACPIQSNPGGATAELIEDGKNGFLIEDPENIDEIEKIISRAVRNKKDLLQGVLFNSSKIKPGLERKL